MSGGGNDPFSNTTNRNVLQHLISPKVVNGSGGGYVVKTDLINVDNIYLTGGIYGPTGAVYSATGASGPSGPSGANGLNGSTGPSGPSGANGVNGVTGATGPSFTSLATLYVAGGSTTGSRVKYSTDYGTTWISATTDPFNATAGEAKAIGYSGSRWVAVGANGTSPTTTITYSDDNGVNWTAATSNPFALPATYSVGGRCIWWNGSIWVAGGSSDAATLSYSYDGDTWYSTSTNPFLLGYCDDVFWNGSKWVAVGTDGSALTQVATSTNGRTWTASSGTPKPFGTGGSANTVAWGGNVWVIGGKAGTSATSIYYSYDGETWTAISGTDPGPSPSTWNKIKWNGSYFLAVGQSVSGPIAAYSKNGITWTSVVTPPFNGSSAIITDATWNGTKWIVCNSNVASGGNFSQSTDGINWTTITDVGGFTSGVQGIHNSTAFWRTTPTTDSSGLLKMLSSLYLSNSNLI